jgi:hypothetical protein
MRKVHVAVVALLLCAGMIFCAPAGDSAESEPGANAEAADAEAAGTGAGEAEADAGTTPAPAENMSFFVTSVGTGNGADLGGLEGADRYCQMLAEEAGAGGRTWRAYLSTQGEGDQPGVDARDRIGDGPWFNFFGVEVAADVATLHGENNVNKDTALTETGQVVQGRGDDPNRHDILTGSQLDGTTFADGEDHTCSNWTSSTEGSAQVGHHDRTGGGDHPTSWNSAHGSRGCSQEDLRGSGGDGLFYCFAIDG